MLGKCRYWVHYKIWRSRQDTDPQVSKINQTIKTEIKISKKTEDYSEQRTAIDIDELKVNLFVIILIFLLEKVY